MRLESTIQRFSQGFTRHWLRMPGFSFVFPLSTVTQKANLRIVRVAILVMTLFSGVNHAFGEGSGSWGVTGNRQANLFVPSTDNSGTENTGYVSRGFMMLASSTGSGAVPYNPAHRMYVWVKSNETVFYGFKTPSESGSVTFNWYYDNTSTGYYPTATTSPNRVLAQAQAIAQGSGAANGRPTNAAAATNGPNQVTGSGYTAYSFKNTTGSDRAYWVEIGSDNIEFNYWDITVASGSAGSYSRKNGRLYCKYWSVVNDLPGAPAGVADANSSPANFGFYIPIDNTYTPARDFYIKYANFGGSGSGFAIFFANLNGPKNNLTFEQNRRSIGGVSSNAHFPLFLSNPDAAIWPSSPFPVATFEAVFSRRPASNPVAGQASFTVNIDNPSIVDILIDLNGNGYYDGKDVILSNEYNAAGTYQISWNGKDGVGADVPTGTAIHFVSSLLFYPVHFPIYDMEQSLGISIKHVRPLRSGTEPVNDKLYWDDTNIARANIPNHSPATLSPRSVQVNVTGVLGPEHKWWANGDNGFSQNNTINTWTGAYNDQIVRDLIFNYSSDVDLAVTKTVSPGATTAGQSVTFTIQATNIPLAKNAGNPLTATGVVVTDEIPDGYTVENVSVSKGSWNAGSSTWTIGTLAELEVVTMTVTAKVNASGPYLNTAIVQGNENDDNQTNNKDDAVVLVAPNSNDHSTSITRPETNQVIPLTGVSGNPPLLSGSDAEDGTYTGKTGTIANPRGVNVTSLPTHGELYYDGALVLLSNVTNKTLFINPALFSIKITGTGYVDISFKYAYVDSDGLTDATPATYTLIWEAALPVTLVSFEAFPEEGRVRLSWRTAIETNASHFEIERSNDAKNWNKFKETAAAGESRELTSYTAIDEAPRSGISYYRLKTVDLDNSFAYSRTVSVDMKNAMPELAIYPNPASNILLIRGVDSKSVSHVSLTNVSGRIVVQFDTMPEKGIDLGQFSSGIYLVRILTKDGLQVVKKVLVSK